MIEPNEIDVILAVTKQLRETYPKETELIFVFNNNTFEIKFIKNDDFLHRLHCVMEENNIRVMPVCEAVFDLDINFSENEILDDNFICIAKLKKINKNMKIQFKTSKTLINSGFIEIDNLVSKLKTKVKENIVNEDLEEKDNYFLITFVTS